MTVAPMEHPKSRELALERLGSFDDLAPGWTALAERQANLFGTWEWASAWWATFGGGREPLLSVARDEHESLVAVLPLYTSRYGPLTLARFIGHGPADQLGPVCAPEDRPAVAEALRRLVADELDMRGFLLAERLWCEEEWPRLLGARPLRRALSSLLPLSGRTFEEWLASVSPKFRREVQRRERNLVRDHGLRFRLVTDEKDRESALAALIHLHDARWRNASTAFEPANRPLYEAFTRLAAERGWLRLWLAEVDGCPIAARLGFYFAGRAWAYQSGRDPAWDKSGVGIVLLVHTLREAFRDGLLEYRLLVGREPYKQNLVPEERWVETLAVGRGPLPAIGTELYTRWRRLPLGTRKRIRRLVPS